MTAQQQAFKFYYSSLSDAELLKIAANKRSFLDVAQEALANELRGRSLAMTGGTAPAEKRSAARHATVLARMAGRVGGWFSHQR